MSARDGCADEALDCLLCARRELDKLWGAARDATSPNPTATPEGNHEVADNAAHELLQMVGLAEGWIETLRRPDEPVFIDRSLSRVERVTRAAMSLGVYPEVYVREIALQLTEIFPDPERCGELELLSILASRLFVQAPEPPRLRVVKGGAP